MKLKTFRLWQKILISLAIFFTLAILGFVIWASNAANADSIALNKFLDISKDILLVKESANYWEISPKVCNQEICSKGMVFYPGAKVEPQAYFYKFGVLAQSQKLFITKPPLNLAYFNINQADDVIINNPEIKNWSIGGHSLGGAMACEYVKTNAAKITNLLLIGSYCNSDIASTKVKVLSIHGDLDGVLTPSKLQENAKNLPQGYKNYPIAGMNHAQAGNYGEQIGDLKFTKSDEQVKSEIQQIIQSNFR
jgi:Icc-related predicted phosphoesterase